MTKILFSLVFLLISHFTSAQQEEQAQNQTFAFSEVEQPPLFKRCKAKWKPKKQRDCTSHSINDFVNRRFNMDLALKSVGKGSGNLEANFIINQAGEIEGLTVTGSSAVVNQHLYEIIMSIKRFKPAMHNGAPVDVSYHLPVSFHIM